MKQFTLLATIVFALHLTAAPEKSPTPTAQYNKVTGKLSSVLPGSIEKNLNNVETAAQDAKVQIVSQKADAISATVKGELADNRAFTIELSGKGFDNTEISIRVAPKGIDFKLLAGDEDASRMLLDYVQKAAGVKKRRKFFGLF